MGAAERKTNARRTRRGGLVGLVLLVGVLAGVAFAAGRPDVRQASGERAPEVTLTTLEGTYRPSARRGEVLVLYFSFVG